MLDGVGGVGGGVLADPLGEDGVHHSPPGSLIPELLTAPGLE